MANIISKKQDMTYLKWSHIRSSSGTAGNFLKSEDRTLNCKTYYKLSNFDSEKGVIGHESMNEIIVDRLLTILGVPHLEYELIHADIQIEGTIYETWICASRDYKEKGESKSALDDYYQINCIENESKYDFCRRNGWKSYIDTMLVIDFLILNRDRHGANIEVLRNKKNKTIRIAPLFDHGLSLLCSCYSENQIEDFDILSDKPCQNFIGSRSTYDNLKYVDPSCVQINNTLSYQDKEKIFEGLQDVLSEKHREKIWNMIWKRWEIYEDFCNKGSQS